MRYMHFTFQFVVFFCFTFSNVLDANECSFLGTNLNDLFDNCSFFFANDIEQRIDYYQREYAVFLTEKRKEDDKQ